MILRQKLRILAALLALLPALAGAQGLPSANQGYMGPASGPPSAPSFRALVPADLAQGTGGAVSITAPPFNAVADGLTDAGPAINSCIAAGNDCIVPPSTLGFFVNTTIQNTGSLRGIVVNFYNPSSASPVNNSSFPGSSWLKCSSSVSPCVQVGGSSLPNLGVAGQLSNLIVSRVSGAPTGGTIGVQWNGGYNAHSENLYAFNHDTCYKWFASGVSGISFVGNGVFAAACQTHHFTFDGWPEAHFTNGRVGADGTADYSSSDFIQITNSSCSGGGCGPNTITFQNYQFNPGSNGPGCALRWSNFTNGPSSTIGSEIKLSGVHIEFGGATGVFCSDSTTTLIQNLYVGDSFLKGSSAPLFALNSATAIKQWFFHDVNTGCTGITLAPTPASGPSFSDVHFSRVFGCSSASFTSNGVGNNILQLTDNNWGALTVAGSWFGLSSSNDQYSSVTDTATGFVSWAAPIQRTWTPVLTFGGGSTGITYSTQFGNWQRTADGGFEAAFQLVLTSKGSSTGAALITGLPKSCANGALQQAAAGPAVVFNVASLTAPAFLYINGTNILPSMMLSGGGSQLADTNFTNTTQMSGTVRCAQTQ